jgi:hypothetical protein
MKLWNFLHIKHYLQEWKVWGFFLRGDSKTGLYSPPSWPGCTPSRWECADELSEVSSQHLRMWTSHPGVVAVDVRWQQWDLPRTNCNKQKSIRSRARKQILVKAAIWHPSENERKLTKGSLWLSRNLGHHGGEHGDARSEFRGVIQAGGWCVSISIQ